MMQAREQYYKSEKFIHDLNPQQIMTILQSSPWSVSGQEITSAETNNDCSEEPNPDLIANGENTAGVDAFHDLVFGDHVKRVLDVGGGKFDVCRNYMKSRGVDLLVYDPYNRPQEHNAEIGKLIECEKVAAATSMSVLNVIAEPEVRLAHICTLSAALEINGTAYFKIWPGEGVLKGCYRPTINSYGHPGYQANAYANRFLREVQLVFGLVNAELCESIPNLIVARKINPHVPALEEILHIQNLSKQDEWYLNKSKSVSPVSQRFFASSASSVTMSADYSFRPNL